MRDTAITLADVSALLAIIVALAGLWWRIEAAIATVRSNAETRISALAKELADYKTQVATEYARNGYLRDVEERVLKRIDGVVSEIHGLRQEIGDAVKLLAAPSKRTR